MRISAVDISGEFLWPVALLARLARGPQIVNGRFYRMIEIARHNANKLVYPVHLCFYECVCSVADMAFNAGHFRMRRGLVGSEFRLHRRMAGLAAKRDRLAYLITLVATDRSAQQEDNTDSAEDEQPPAFRRVGKIDGEPAARFFAVDLSGVPPLKPRAQSHDSQSEKQKTGRDDVGENAKIWIAVMSKKIDGK